MKFFNLNAGHNRVFGLDLLRFIAIFMVLIGHSKMFLPVQYKPIFDHILFDGVAIFFVLSGYLIGGILIKQLEKEPATFGGLLHFWKRRWMRTLPAYLFVLLFLFAFTLIFLPDQFPKDWFKYPLFIQNFINERNGFFAESWSLSIEEWFYLTIPLLLYGTIYFLKTKVKTTVALVGVLVLIAITFYRFQTYTGYGYQKQISNTEVVDLTKDTSSLTQEYSVQIKNSELFPIKKAINTKLKTWKWNPTTQKNKPIEISGDMNKAFAHKGTNKILPFVGEVNFKKIKDDVQINFKYTFTKENFEAAKLKYLKLKIKEASDKAYLPKFEKFINTHLEFQVIPRLDAILIGLLGAFIAFYFPKIWNNKLNILFAVIGGYLLYYCKVNMGPSYEEFAVVWYPFYKSLAVLLMLPFLTNWKSGFGIWTKWVTFFSLISYSMYLVNLNVVSKVLIKNVIHGNWTGKVSSQYTKAELYLNDMSKADKWRHVVGEDWAWDYTLFWVFTIGISFLMYKLIETPFMNLRDKKKKFGANS